MPDSPYRTITPVFNVKGADELIQFCKALGAEELRRMPGPNNMVMHADLKFGDSIVMVSDAVRDAPTTSAVSFMVDDCDAMFERAVAAGATPVAPPMDMQVAKQRWARVVDKWGNGWAFVTPR